METHAVASVSAGPYEGEPDGKFKQPSEKIKALAAISLSSKVGYLALRDIIGPDDLQVYSLLNSLPVKSFRDGERVYPRDKQEPLLCYIKRGTVEIYRPSPQGKRRLVKRIGEGILFGEMRMLGQTMLGSEADAKDWAEVVFLTTADSEELIANSRGLAWRLVRQLGP
ncbi:MAG: cyclic nucleotide-binding domain-containing protein, partial [Blastocatellia bacterium]